MTRFSPYRIQQGESNYPSSVAKYLLADTPRIITALGNLDILRNNALAVFCSNKCPGNIILKTCDLMRQIREKGSTVISGFHSAVERECVNILLRGRQPVIICPAHGIEGMRIKPEYRKPLEDGRLLILSTFSEKEKHISSDRANERNCFAGAIAASIFIPYAEPSSNTEKLCKILLNWNKPVFTFQTEFTMNLISLGVKNIENIVIAGAY
jgi:predicted Rossmann fold nucleotide-binding protein DprA/Smf involved in DNA uptake